MGRPFLFLLGLLFVACIRLSGKADAPDARGVLLLVSADSKGYLEDCGCSDSRLGGWPGRAALLDSLRETGWRLLQLELGNLHKPRCAEACQREALFLKRGLQRQGVSHWVAGPGLLALPDSAARNFVYAPGPALLDTLLEDELLLLAMNGHSVTTLEGMPEARAESGPLVALYRGRIEDALEQELPAAVACLLVAGDSRVLRSPMLSGQGVAVLALGDRMRYLAAVPLAKPNLPFLLPVRQDSLHAEADSLRSFRRQEKLRREARQRDEMQRRRRALGWPALDPQGDRFAGHEACVLCHTEIHQAWREGAHARVYAERLRRPGRPDTGELARLVTGLLEPGGYLDYESTPDRVNVQCEACHGAGEGHLSDPSAKGLPRNPWSACASCHTETDILSLRSFRHGMKKGSD